VDQASRWDRGDQPASRAGTSPAPPARVVDDLHRAARKGALTLERQPNLRIERRRQPHTGSEQQRQHDQFELVERAERAEGLDRARATDEMNVAAVIGRPELLQQPRRVGVADHVVGGPRRTL
jgi:hypothetical protein